MITFKQPIDTSPGGQRRRLRLNAYDAGRYGDAVGRDYDELYPGSDTAAAVALLRAEASAHPTRSLLEFGIGTGRLALPIAEHAIHVTGIDGSEHMVQSMRSKPGGADIPVTIGDYRDTWAGRGDFSVVVLAFNGIFDPRGRGAQLDIFRNAARHLAPDGLFVVETWVLDDQQRNGEWFINPRFVGEQHVELQLARYDIDANRIERTLVHLRPSGPRFVTVTDTYAAPGELDILADITGFDRAARYSKWDRTPFTSTSANQVSLFRLRNNGR